ncbi:MAG: hypothetical protein PHD55_08320 [Methanoregula sp.]|nr:hypothetical protein [Methanoregula sp.]
MKLSDYAGIIIVTGLALLLLLVVPNGVVGQLPDESSAQAQAHIDPTIPWITKNASRIGDDTDTLLKNETFMPGIASCNMSGPIRIDSLNTSTDSNVTASALYTLYKEEFNDPDYDYFIVWMKGAGSSRSGTDANESRIRELRSGIILERDTDRITDWSPYTDTSGPAVSHEETVKLGKCMSISEDYTLQQGRTGVGSIYPGTANTPANFTIRWQGNLNGTQAIVGGAEIQVPKNAGYNYTVVIGVNGTNDKVT